MQSQLLDGGENTVHSLLVMALWTTKTEVSSLKNLEPSSIGNSKLNQVFDSARLRWAADHTDVGVREWYLLPRDRQPEEALTYRDYLAGLVEEESPPESYWMRDLNLGLAHPAATKVRNPYPVAVTGPHSSTSIARLGHSPQALAHLHRKRKSTSLEGDGRAALVDAWARRQILRPPPRGRSPPHSAQDDKHVRWLDSLCACDRMVSRNSHRETG